MADVNLFFDPIRNEDAGYQFIDDTLQSAAAPSVTKKIYFGAIQATNIVYVNSSGVSQTVSQVYYGSTLVYGSGGSTSSQLTGITYTVSSTYSSTSAPTYQYMNDNNANGSTNGNQWGSNGAAGEYITADLGLTKTITKIVVGYDYLTNLPGGWGVTYTEGLSVQTSPDNSTWTTQTTTPTYASSGSSNGLVTINISNVNARYIRLYKATASYIAALEFQVWGY